MVIQARTIVSEFWKDMVDASSRHSEPERSEGEESHSLVIPKEILRR